MATNRDVNRCLRYIDEHFAEELTVETLAEVSGYSRDRLKHLFGDSFGVPLFSYIRRLRLRKAAAMLREGVSAAEAARLSGFTSPSVFSRAFTAEFSVSPKRYARAKLSLDKAHPYSDGLNPRIRQMEPASVIAFPLRTCAVPLEQTDVALWFSFDFKKIDAAAFNACANGSRTETGFWLRSGSVQTYYYGCYGTQSALIPDGYRLFTMPAGNYAQFTTLPAPLNGSSPDFHAAIVLLQRAIYELWFPANAGLVRHDTPVLEYYCAMNGCYGDGACVMDILVPVK